MTSSALAIDDIPLAEIISPEYEQAAELLDRGIQGGCQDGNVFYLLGLAHRRQGKIEEARKALRRIARPDASVFLQLGLLSLDEQQYAQAAEEFQRAVQSDANSYAAAFNLLMARLTLGQIPGMSELAERSAVLAASDEDGRLLRFLALLLAGVKTNTGSRWGNRVSLPGLTLADEARLLQLIKSIGEPETVRALLRSLRQACSDSKEVHEAYFEATLAHAYLLVERSNWFEAERLLASDAEDISLEIVPPVLRAAFFNLLGCCTCLNQDLKGGLAHLRSALDHADDDPRLRQNLALAEEWVSGLARAEGHWNTFLDLLDGRWPAPPGLKYYAERLAFETLNRLSVACAETEQWGPALEYMERARRVRPDEPEVLERLFHLYQQNKKPNQARHMLARLRELKPNEPQYELYDLDFAEVKSLNDVERMLSDIEDILRRHPGDSRVDERAVAMVRNVVPLLCSLCDQLTDQMSRVIDQVRRLPHYQINWRAVHDVMRDLRREFNKLRRIAAKCQSLVRTEDNRRIIRDLLEHIDRKIEVCQQMGG
jgi:tetratricopeptide (TPR) repeat protein